MAKLQMQKIEIIALLSDSKRIIERLQRRGVVELYNCNNENFEKINPTSSIIQFEKSMQNAVSALDVLKQYGVIKENIFSSFSDKVNYIPDDFGKQINKSDVVFRIIREINDNAKSILDCENEISKLKTLIDILNSWTTLDIPSDFNGTAYTSFVVGTIPKCIEIEELKQSLTENCEIKIISQYKNQTNFAVVFLKSEQEELFGKLKELNFSQFTLSERKTPNEKINECKEKISLNEEKINNCINKIKSNSEYVDSIKLMVDYMQMRIDKYDALKDLGLTEHTFVLTGYIPKKYADAIKTEFENKYTICISLFDIEDEDTPVLLENNAFNSPVEGITEMYALPGKKDLDPTPIMAFFYYLFFGMMLSDAGYGLVMVVATCIFLKKFTLSEKLKKTIIMFRNCGISTVIWGALFGSWYGDLPQVIAREFFGKELVNIHGVKGSTALWFQPLDNPVKLLLFSFLLGIIHLFVGLGANFYKLAKQEGIFNAIFEVVPIMLTVAGAAPLAATILTSVPTFAINIGKYVLIVGVILIVLTSSRSSKNIFMRFFGGIYGLYNVATGYLSDILSYSRLLALGLATGCIASVINLVGVMPSNTVIKAILLTVLVLVAHTANIAINLLGAYVHADRLQFVELFSKFYEGGGKAFNPLKINSKYMQFKEDK